VADVVVELVDARAAVLARPTVALVELALAHTARVPGPTTARVVAGAVDAPAVHARHARTVVRVQLAPTAVET